MASAKCCWCGCRVSFDAVRIVKYPSVKCGDVNVRVCPECHPFVVEAFAWMDDNARALLTGYGSIGATPASRIDGRAMRWGWGCRCGSWDDGYGCREQTRAQYREHRRTCRAATGRGRVVIIPRAHLPEIGERPDMPAVPPGRG